MAEQKISLQTALPAHLRMAPNLPGFVQFLLKIYQSQKKDVAAEQAEPRRQGLKHHIASCETMRTLHNVNNAVVKWMGSQVTLPDLNLTSPCINCVILTKFFIQNSGCCNRTVSIVSFKSENVLTILSTALVIVNITTWLLVLSQRAELLSLDRMVY